MGGVIFMGILEIVITVFLIDRLLFIFMSASRFRFWKKFCYKMINNFFSILVLNILIGLIITYVLTGTGTAAGFAHILSAIGSEVAVPVWLKYKYGRKLQLT